MKLFFSNHWQNPQITATVHYFQKQPLELFCKKGVLKKVLKFHRETTVLESVFNKVLQLYLILIPKLLRLHLLIYTYFSRLKSISSKVLKIIGFFYYKNLFVFKSLFIITKENYHPLL